MTNLEGRVILRRRVQAPPRRREDGHRDLRAGSPSRLGRVRGFRVRRRRSRCSTSSGARPRAPRRTTAASTYEAIDRGEGRVLAVPRAGPPGTPRLFAERFASPVGAREVHLRSVSPRGGAPGRGLPALLHDRALQGALQLRRADPPGGRADATPSRSRSCRSTRGSQQAARGHRRRLARGSRAGAAACVFAVTVSSATSGPTRCSRRSTGAAARPPTCSPFRRSIRRAACRVQGMRRARSSARRDRRVNS